MRLTPKRGRLPDVPFDLDRLTPEERELWDRYFSGPLPENEGPLTRVWGFGQACMLELSGPPEVVAECLEEHDPTNKILRYQENLRRARREREARDE